MRSFGDRRLQLGIEDFDDATPFGAALVPTHAEIAHQLLELPQHTQVDFVVVLAELDQQDRLRRLAHELVERRLEDRNFARELDHRAVDQFHRDRLEAHDVLRRIHRLEEAAEVAGADRAAAEQWRKLQLDAR